MTQETTDHPSGAQPYQCETCETAHYTIREAEECCAGSYGERGTAAPPKFDAERAKILRAEIGKVRCWLTGFHAGRNGPGAMQPGVPGEESLRQVQMFLEDLCRGR